MKFVVETVGHGEDVVLGHQPVYQMLRGKIAVPFDGPEQARKHRPVAAVVPRLPKSPVRVSMLSGFRGRSVGEGQRVVGRK